MTLPSTLPCSERDFCREYQNPILRGREPDATDKEREKGEAKSAELGKIVNQFILRRTNTLLSKHLPPKLVCVVCCSMSTLQLQESTGGEGK
jgi:DNA repair and recombination RAD54-like protein